MFNRKRKQEIEDLRYELSLIRNPPAPPPGGRVELMEAFIEGLHVGSRLAKTEETVVQVGGEEIRCQGNVTIQVNVEK